MPYSCAVQTCVPYLWTYFLSPAVLKDVLIVMVICTVQYCQKDERLTLVWTGTHKRPLKIWSGLSRIVPPLQISGASTVLPILGLQGSNKSCANSFCIRVINKG